MTGRKDEARNLVCDGAGLVVDDDTCEKGGERRFCGAGEVLDHLHRVGVTSGAIVPKRSSVVVHR